jgi:hypothetical protein
MMLVLPRPWGMATIQAVPGLVEYAFVSRTGEYLQDGLVSPRRARDLAHAFRMLGEVFGQDVLDALVEAADHAEALGRERRRTVPRSPLRQPGRSRRRRARRIVRQPAYSPQGGDAA